MGRVTGEQFQQAEDSGSYPCVRHKGSGLLHAEVFPLSPVSPHQLLQLGIYELHFTASSMLATTAV